MAKVGESGLSVGLNVGEGTFLPGRVGGPVGEILDTEGETALLAGNGGGGPPLGDNATGLGDSAGLRRGEG